MNRYPAAILFDLDDTLISFNGVSEEAWDLCCSDFILKHPSMSKDVLLSAIYAEQSWYWSDPIRHKIGRENIRQARRDYVGLALEKLGMTDVGAIHDLADRYTARHDALTHLYPNTLATLDTLKREGVRMTLITNGHAQGQRGKLTRFGLTDYFEHILIDQELGFGKPDVRVYEYALSLLGLSGHDVWMVGDNLVWDIQPPQTLGIHATWHDCNKSGLNPAAGIIPDRIITDIGELVCRD